MNIIPSGLVFQIGVIMGPIVFCVLVIFLVYYCNEILDAYDDESALKTAARVIGYISAWLLAYAVVEFGLLQINSGDEHRLWEKGDYSIAKVLRKYDNGEYLRINLIQGYVDFEDEDQNQYYVHINDIRIFIDSAALKPNAIYCRDAWSVVASIKITLPDKIYARAFSPVTSINE